jgi:hypothetical protein
MLTAITVFRSSGEVAEMTIDMTERPTFAELRRIVTPLLHGAQMLHVRVLDPVNGDDSLDLFVDEIGVLKRLTFNKKATELYRAAWLRDNPGDDPGGLPYIAGDAVLFRRKVWDGRA